MNNEINKIEKQIQELEKKKEELIKLEESKDFIELKHNEKTIRIYKWENRPYKDFPMPKGFDFCEFNDFIELYNNDLIEIKPDEYFLVKHYSKKHQKKNYGNFVGLCLSRYLGLYSDNVDSDLEYSFDYGRVVISK